MSRGRKGSHGNTETSLFRDPRKITAPLAPSQDPIHTMIGTTKKRKAPRGQGQTHFAGGTGPSLK